MTTYIALPRKEEGSDFGIEFLDFPGCVTAGRSLEEAGALAREALEGHIELLLEAGEEIAEPSSLDAVMAEPGNRGAIPILIEVATGRPKTVRVNVTIPEPILAQIDAYAARHGFSRSRFLTDVARRVLAGAKQ